MNVWINYKYYILIQLKFLKELILIKMLYRKLTFQADICSGCHDVLKMSVNLNNIAILGIRGFDYRCIINEISRSDAVNLPQSTDLIEERGI